MDEPLIVKVIHRYYPGWDAPKDNGKDWLRCLCPFHSEDTPSAAVSYERGAFRCLACDTKGDVVTLIKRQEEVSYAEAQRIAEGLSTGSDKPVPRQPARKSSRRVFGDKGIDERDGKAARGQVPTGIRGRSTPWT
ncbi:DNA primase [Mycobacterium phage SWU2]|uniref:DNA primase n=1 Tax=Mycobacterium phage SWU2 TaxID=2077150 RepID=A0A2K9VI40_9CAUD|nr:DNA primase [Mycobacterium phage SWU2]AUV62014.1 DNA primase [Mycobacterium phage SWU2]